jgi:hypothetical protein
MEAELIDGFPRYIELSASIPENMKNMVFSKTT